MTKGCVEERGGKMGGILGLGSIGQVFYLLGISGEWSTIMVKRKRERRLWTDHVPGEVMLWLLK